MYTRSCSPLVPVLFSLSENNTSSYYSIERAEELLLKHEDDELVFTIVSVENLHIH
jgi:hypothetical protein